MKPLPPRWNPPTHWPPPSCAQPPIPPPVGAALNTLRPLRISLNRHKNSMQRFKRHISRLRLPTRSSPLARLRKLPRDRSFLYITFQDPIEIPANPTAQF